MWKARAYEDKDFDDLIELEKDNYGDICISNKEYLKWEYYSNPCGKALIQLAVDINNNNLAGEYVVIPRKIKVQEKELISTLSLNTLTKKEYRGQGVFTGLAEAVYKDCKNQDLAFTYGFPNQNSYPGFVKKLSFKELGQVPLLLKPLDYKVLIEKKVNNLLSKFVPKFNSYKKYKYINSKYKLYDIDATNVKDIDVLWNKIKNNYKVLGVRDSQFIKWRYIDIPLREYKIIAVKKADDILGYIIGNVKDVDGICSGMIVDFVFDHNSPEIGKILLHEMMRYFKNKDVHLAGALMMENSDEYRILKENGFYRCPKRFKPQQFPVIYRAHTVEGESECLNEFQNWFLTMGDYDVI